MKSIIFERKVFNNYIKATPVIHELYHTHAGWLELFSTDKGLFKAVFITGKLPKVPVRITPPEHCILVGTDFQVAVWQAALKIPKNTVLTYSQLAQSIGRSKAHRAVATALANNTIAYFIPCHRIIGKNKALCGYKWGVDRKQILITAEGTTHS